MQAEVEYEKKNVDSPSSLIEQGVDPRSAMKNMVRNGTNNVNMVKAAFARDNR